MQFRVRSGWLVKRKSWALRDIGLQNTTRKIHVIVHRRSWLVCLRVERTEYGSGRAEFYSATEILILSPKHLIYSVPSILNVLIWELREEESVVKHDNILKLAIQRIRHLRVSACSCRGCFEAILVLAFCVR